MRHCPSLMRTALALLLCLTGLAYALCAAEARPVKPENYVLATSLAKGLVHRVGARLAALATRSGLPMIEIMSAGSVENIELLATGKAHFALLQDNVANDAFRGILKFAHDSQVNLRGMVALYPDVMHCLATEKSNINTWADLAGKRLATGEIGSGTERTTGEILDLYAHRLLGRKSGVRVSRMEFSLALKSLIRGRVDAAALVLGAPNALIQDALDKKNLRFVDVEANIAASLHQAQPSYVTYTLAAGIYGPKQPNPVATVATQTVLICHQDTDPHDVLRLLTVLFENQTALVMEFPAMKDFSLNAALTGVTIPLHSGALHYFKDAGVSIPERLR